MEESYNSMMPYLRSMATCLKNMMVAGYTEMFKRNDKGITSLSNSKTYCSDEIKVINSFRFEGPTGSENKATMYIIETRDGLKGTMVDTEGRRSDQDMNTFIRDVDPHRD